MSVRSIIRGQLDLLRDPTSGLFDAHAHTGADIDGTVRTAEDHVADLAAIGGRSVIFPLSVEGGYATDMVTAIDWSQPVAARNALALALTLSATRDLQTHAAAGRVSKGAVPSSQPAAGLSHLGAEVRGHDHQGGPR